MEIKKIKLGALNRGYKVDKSAINEELRTVELSFSSEIPYERYFGMEILDHNSTSIRMGRLMDGAPLLLDHDANNQIGVIESINIGADRVGRATVRFSKSQKAQEVFQDVIDGIRSKISVGYIVHEMVMEAKQNDNDVYRVTDWEPLEISVVSIPADGSVGIGRNVEITEKEFVFEINKETDDEVVNTDVLEEEVKKEEKSDDIIKDNVKNIDTVVEIKENKEYNNNIINYKKDNKMDIQKNINEIMSLGDKFEKNGGKDLANSFIRNGKFDVEEFKTALFEKLETSGAIKTAEAKSNEAGLSSKEVKEYSLLNAIRSHLEGTNSKEMEISATLAKQLGKKPQGILIPAEILKRDYNVGTAIAGGNTVATNLMASDFITMFRNKLVMRQLGAQFMSGLTDKIQIPRQSGGVAVGWVNENGALSESSATFDQIGMTPKTMGAYSMISRSLLKQSSLDVEMFVMNELATACALELDRVAINGTGLANQPKGILATTGIGAVSLGANGGVPDWNSIVALESAVANVNADVGAMNYLTNTKMRGKLKTVLKAAGLPFIYENGNKVNGYNAAITNAMRSDLTKGTGTALSSMIFGNFADIIIGQWGVLDLLVDPYSASSTGALKIVAFQDVDVVVRHPESFAAIIDAVTV